jgi:hypothetical protein
VDDRDVGYCEEVVEDEQDFNMGHHLVGQWWD